MVKDMEKGVNNMKMDNSMRVNGKMIRRMVMVG